MCEFFVRPSTGGICRTWQNLPPRTGPRCFTQTFCAKVEAPANRVRVPPTCDNSTALMTPALQKTLRMIMDGHLASSSRESGRSFLSSPALSPPLIIIIILLMFNHGDNDASLTVCSDRQTVHYDYQSKCLHFRLLACLICTPGLN